MDCERLELFCPERAMSLRTKYTNRVHGERSPEQRLGQFTKLQQASFDVLLASPVGYQNYLRRNLLSRRIEVVDGEYQPVSSDRRAQQP